jgi:hypothetical protein
MRAGNAAERRSGLIPIRNVVADAKKQVRRRLCFPGLAFSRDRAGTRRRRVAD